MSAENGHIVIKDEFGEYILGIDRKRRYKTVAQQEAYEKQGLPMTKEYIASHPEGGPIQSMIIIEDNDLRLPEVKLTSGYVKKLVAQGKMVTEKARKAQVKIKTEDTFDVVDFITELNYLLGYISALETQDHEPRT